MEKKISIWIPVISVILSTLIGVSVTYGMMKERLDNSEKERLELARRIQVIEDTKPAVILERVNNAVKLIEGVQGDVESLRNLIIARMPN